MSDNFVCNTLDLTNSLRWPRKPRDFSLACIFLIATSTICRKLNRKGSLVQDIPEILQKYHSTYLSSSSHRLFNFTIAVSLCEDKYPSRITAISVTLSDRSFRSLRFFFTFCKCKSVIAMSKHPEFNFDSFQKDHNYTEGTFHVGKWQRLSRCCYCLGCQD